ncbi:hypothetical protein GGR58DRAFT_519267 [Xylaria digitata]|nr:hypothetical protein GGR58DRAFT_519267 [Xylaria digitata]
MDYPVTPKKQIRPILLAQQLTPPTTMAKKEVPGASNHHDYSFSTPIHCLLHDEPVAHEAGVHENLAPSLHDHGAKQSHGTQISSESAQAQHSKVQTQQEVEGKLLGVQLNQGEPEAENQQAVIVQQSNATKQQPGADDRPQGEIVQWLHSSTSREQRRQRFTSFLHSLWPSNDEFNAARHPFYDPEEDGLYDDFIKYQEWDGDCPYDDDDYNPFTDPTRSTEVWQPKIGDEGIENEYDLQMVLKARREHIARSENLKAYRRRRDQLMSTSRTGFYATRGFLNKPEDPLSESDPDSGSEAGSDHDGGIVTTGPEPAVKMEEPSPITNAPRTGNPVIQPTVSAKGIRVFGDQRPNSGRGRPRGRKNKPKNKPKKSKKPNKRRRGRNDDPESTYQYPGDSSDDQPIYKKGKKSKSETAAGNLPWKAETRAAARRAARMGVDGACDIDTDSSNSSAWVSESGESGEDELWENIPLIRVNFK